MSSQDFFAPISDELKQVEERLYQAIETEIPELKTASEHLLKAGGKRLRPAFALLSGAVFSNDLSPFISLAAALELVHMATLVHDDVIDNSPTRRGTQTVKNVWGNRMSIYSGDYLFSRALSLIAAYGRSDVVSVLAAASVQMVEGELRQLRSCFDVHQPVTEYLRRIERKTALLISLSCQTGAMIAGASGVEVDALRRFGYYLGMAFQITDDVLDFIADEALLGKPTGSDIRQGVITLPALYALRNSSERETLARILGSAEAVSQGAEQALELIRDSGGIEYALEVSDKYLLKAQTQLLSLPEGWARDTMTEIADFISQREA
ncbi:MAG: polyprenyl synthetase family protein [Solirubrobacterales bacterium]